MKNAQKQGREESKESGGKREMISRDEFKERKNRAERKKKRGSRG